MQHDSGEVTPVIKYVAEEVWRQGFKLSTPRGLLRVGWMLTAWADAMDWSGIFNVNQVLYLGRTIERQINEHGFRTHNVKVGDRICPSPGDVPRLMTDWVEWVDEKQPEPLHAYRQFEMIHPFGDGNGRTGKVILNVLNGTMHDPIFPPHDFWGAPIRNP